MLLCDTKDQKSKAYMEQAEQGTQTELNYLFFNIGEQTFKICQIGRMVLMLSSIFKLRVCKLYFYNELVVSVATVLLPTPSLETEALIYN